MFSFAEARNATLQAMVDQIPLLISIPMLILVYHGPWWTKSSNNRYLRILGKFDDDHPYAWAVAVWLFAVIFVHGGEWIVRYLYSLLVNITRGQDSTAEEKAAVAEAEEATFDGGLFATKDEKSGSWPQAKREWPGGVPPLAMRVGAIFKRRSDLQDERCETSADADIVKSEKGHATFTRRRVAACRVVGVNKSGLTGSMEYHRSKRASKLIPRANVGERALLAQTADNVAAIVSHFAANTAAAKKLRAKIDASTTQPGSFGENLFLEGETGYGGGEISSKTLCVGGECGWKNIFRDV